NSYIDYNLNENNILFPIYPVQPPIPKSNTKKSPFIINQYTYSKDDFYSPPLVNVENIGFMRGIRLARLAICPFAYNPVKKILRIYYEITATLNFDNANIPATKELKKLNSTPYFNNSNNNIFNFKPLLSTKDYITKPPIKYVIVSPITYQAVLQPFIEWKTKKGFIVIEAYTNNPQVGNTTTSIKNYLKNLYNAGTPSDPPPSFVLFVGDVDQIPSFNGTTGSHVTDLYYCEYTNDFLPEVYYGRFSCSNTTELQTQINKTIEYEQYLMPDDSFLNEVVMIAGADASMSPTYANGQINYGVSTYFNASNGLTSNTYLYPNPPNTSSQIKQNVSNGCAFVNYTAHGSSNGWADPSFTVADISNLQNSGKYPLMVGNACLTNKFDEPVCFGEALLRANNKGALGYIGASDYTYWDEDYYWSVGAKNITASPTYDPNALGAYDRTFHTHGEAYDEWYVTQGQMIFAGNLAVTEISSSYDIFPNN
ncbi:MAG TPA: C25 family cysteine peptidase, partial [Bacteroidales bacterium]|nr:C25 family cysteine peptidase [Bacteroidales bacterium]